MGNALRNVGRFNESLDRYRKSLEQKPQYSDAHNNLAIALSEMGLFEEPMASYTRCPGPQPNHVDAHMNRARPGSARETTRRAGPSMSGAGRSGT